MRLPVRSRGVLAGLALLATSPVVALVGSHGGHPAAAGAAGTPVAAAVARLAAPTPALHLVLAPHDASMSEAATPAPTPAPTPPPTPAPTPTPKARAAATPAPAPAVSYPAGSIQAIITAAAQAHGVSASWMISIARCESGLNPNAYNPSGPYIGLFQFLPSTFRAHGGTNIYDPTQQANITATMLAAGQAHQWSCA